MIAATLSLALALVAGGDDYTYKLSLRSNG